MLIRRNNILATPNNKPSNSPATTRPATSEPLDTFVPSESQSPSLIKAVLGGAAVVGGFAFGATALMAEAVGAFSYLGGQSSLGTALAASFGIGAVAGGLLAGVYRENLF